jgi:ferric-dicitrate binding protein FerR (iron transport regulator)
MENVYDFLPLFFKNQCSPEQIEAVKKWRKDNLTEFKELESIWALSKDHEFIQFDEKNAWQELKPQLTANETKIISITFFLKITAAAAVILLAVYGGLQMYEKPTPSILMAEENTNISSTKLRGFGLFSENEVEKTDLKSGDQIWLNKNSMIEDFGSDNARYTCRLHKGEVFFDIKSLDEEHDEPFSVYTHNTTISVTANQFSVATDDHQTIVYAVSGKVHLITEKINQLILNKGEKVIVENGKFSQIEKFSNNDLSWKTGSFVFEDTPLDQVVSLLNSFYSAEIDLDLDTTLTFTGEFNNDSFAEVINNISNTLQLTLEEVDKDKFYILSTK